MPTTWPIVSLLLLFLASSNLEAKEQSKWIDREPLPDEYSVYDLLDSTKPSVPSILNFKTWTEEGIKFHRKLIVLVYYSRKKCLQCAQREKVLEEVIDRFHPQVEFHRYNCDEEFDRQYSQSDMVNTGKFKVETCLKNYPDRLPTVSFIVPEQNVFFPYDPITFNTPQFEPDFSDPNSLGDMIDSYMPVFAKRIKNIEDTNHFVEQFGHLSKVLYFLNSEEVPVYFKGLSAVYKDKLEFGLVSPDAYEVVEFFNVTSRPKWVVVKIKNMVNMEQRKYNGKLSFPDVNNYLSLFASKNQTDRTQTSEMHNKRIRDQVLKNGSKITVDEISYTHFKSNFDHPDDIIILHVTDTFSMNYPNLHTFQTFYGYIEALGNNLQKKRFIKKYLPDEHKPYIIIYPRGNVSEKFSNMKILGANHTVEDLLDTVSAMLSDTIDAIQDDQLESRIVKSVFDRKLTLVLFHDEKEISLGLRRLALSPYYRKYFDFYQMQDPPKDRMKQLGIHKLSKLILFMADPTLLAEPDSSPPIDKVSYELPFHIDRLKMFLDDMIAEHGVFLQPVPEIKTQSDLQVMLLDSSARYYLIFIVDKLREIANEQLVDRQNDMLILTKFAGKTAASAWIDIGCHPYLQQTFRFDKKQVPLMVVYDSTTGSFVRSEFRLNIYDGRDLIDKAIYKQEMNEQFRPARLEIGYSACNQETETENEKTDL